MKGYWFGLLLSALSTLLIATSSALALTDTGVLPAVYLGLYLALPALVTLLIAWGCYAVRNRGGMPGSVHALMLLPSLAAASILPLGSLLAEARQHLFSERHPAIAEIHVNLSGQDLWIDPRHTSTRSGGGLDLPLAADAPERFSVLTRWPYTEEIDQGRFPYDGTRLKADYRAFPRQLGGNGEGELTPAPLRLTAAYPDAPELAQVHQYYHYADHVQVTAALRRDSRLESSRAKRLAHAPVLVAAANLGERAIVRIEINDQPLAMDIREQALQPVDGCWHGYPDLGPALLPLDAPWRVRWQEAQAPFAWREAEVTLPPQPLDDALQRAARLPRVLLYFAPDGQVLAERFQEIELDNDRIGLVNSGVPEALPVPAPCGSALERYDLTRVVPLSQPWLRAPRPARQTDR